MFTTSSKYFFGLTGLSVIAAIVYMIVVNPNDLGALALFSLATAGGTIGGFALYTRDSEADVVEEATAAALRSPGASIWPIVTALGAAVTLLGLATIPAWFIIGIAVTVAGAAEWAIQNWAERASAEKSYNYDLRERIIGGLEYPGLAAAILVLIAYPFSRIMLIASKSGAAVIFIVVAAAIMTMGFLIAFKPSVRGKVTVIVASGAAAALMVAGVASAFAGERAELTEAAEKDHFSAEHRECGAEKSKYFDKHANNTVSLRSAVTATVFVEDGKVYAQAIGLKKNVESITVPRSNPVAVMFRNKDDKDFRLVAHLGSQVVGDTGVKEKIEDCTQLTGKNQEQILLLNIPKPAEANDPYKLSVPGAQGEIEVIVP